MIECPVCNTHWSRTQTKVCPKCGATPSGMVPAAPGSAFNSNPKAVVPPAEGEQK